MEEREFVVVCTEFRGVFGGMVFPSDKEKDQIEITDVQMCVYWPSEQKGILGLASHGPLPGCRVTDPVDSMVLNKITAVMDVSDGAKEKWRACPWG